MNAIATPESAAHCLVAAAEYCEALEAVVELAPGTWFVHFETGGECLVEWAESPTRLVVTTGVGEPRESARAGIYASCLEFNTLWSEMGSMRLAKDDEDEQLLLINDFSVDDEHEAHVELANALLRQEGMRLFWSLIVDNATDEASAARRPLDMLAMQRA
ncbi:MAG: type III secretion system chaperone [Hydrogenophaga sp.]|uniref:type III secretion system chaperone n=1 Tax=Hydrogenophaga sp. TaxID=1904254 RepID=UPI001DFEF9D2|nr:type III secretion system chaperone [Hydrogenophaga sp.]MBX3610703.1 type III secretion system chaperone [Hydrogenophaga sp.]